MSALTDRIAADHFQTTRSRTFSCSCTWFPDWDAPGVFRQFAAHVAEVTEAAVRAEIDRERQVAASTELAEQMQALADAVNGDLRTMTSLKLTNDSRWSGSCRLCPETWVEVVMADAYRIAKDHEADHRTEAALTRGGAS
ncbi:hypothetical protein [Georgenia wangjunii]|uniref:hypothetical protein n=1 Tax=Georgenia wangjunii TaxID=3117730 RepID=UPI002F26D3DC